METEEFWKGEFGDEYHKRHLENADNIIYSNRCFFGDIFWRSFLSPGSILELGCGVGHNLKALRQLFPSLYPGQYVTLNAVEISDIVENEVTGADNIYKGSVFNNPFTSDLVFTKGLLIHIPPEKLQEIYEVIYKASNKDILICEYYNPTPMEVEYRGNQGKLWKRDFAGEMLDKFPDLKLIDYGFKYHRDPWPQDDITWFLMRKT